MTAPRFYCFPPLLFDDTFQLPPEAAHHASQVLRLRLNDKVQFFDGIGNAVNAHIREIKGKRVILEKLQPCDTEQPMPLPIVLAQAMCSSEKMDWVVQKATELGVAEIQPVQTQRSVAKLIRERAEKRTEHWRGVSIAACEQCGRNTLPRINSPLELSAWLAQLDEPHSDKFVLLPEGAATLHQLSLASSPRRIVLLIGPEGGFSTSEVMMTRQTGFKALQLGSRIMRTETAALAGIVAMQTLWGDFY